MASFRMPIWLTDSAQCHSRRPTRRSGGAYLLSCLQCRLFLPKLKVVPRTERIDCEEDQPCPSSFKGMRGGGRKLAALGSPQLPFNLVWPAWGTSVFDQSLIMIPNLLIASA